MKRNRKHKLAVMFSICMSMTMCILAGGMQVPKKEDLGAGSSMDGDDGSRIKGANEMTARNHEYERLGRRLIDVLSTGDSDTGTDLKDTTLTFPDLGSAKSFAQYFYRYLYLGKEELLLEAARSGNQVRLYARCSDPGKAAKEHLKVLRTLETVAAVCEGMGDAEKAEAFYTWVYDNVEYDESLNRQTVYDAVTEGSSVCWGFVSTYLILCRTAGLTCEPVYRGNHAWNRVWVDGEWKHSDITWDKNLKEHNWKLITEEEMEADPMHRILGGAPAA